MEELNDEEGDDLSNHRKILLRLSVTGEDSAVHNRIRRDTGYPGHEYHLLAAAPVSSHGEELIPYKEDYATMLAFSTTMMILILLTFPAILLAEMLYQWCLGKRGNRRVSSSEEENSPIEGGFSDDLHNPKDSVIFTHNNENYEIVELANSSVQCEMDRENANPTPIKEIQNSKGTSTDTSKCKTYSSSLQQTTKQETCLQPKLDPSINMNSSQLEDVGTQVLKSEWKRDAGTEKSKTAMANKSIIAVPEGKELLVERFYYTRPVQQQRSMAAECYLREEDKDTQTQTSAFDIEKDCTLVRQISSPVVVKNQHPQMEQVLANEIRPKTADNETVKCLKGKSARFQPAPTSNTILPRRLPCEPSRGHIDIGRNDFQILSRSSHLTWCDVKEHTENYYTPNYNDRAQQQCSRRNNELDSSESGVCIPQRDNARRSDSKCWSWW